MRLSPWLACGVLLVSTAVPLTVAAANPGPRHVVVRTSYCHFSKGPKAKGTRKLGGKQIVVGSVCSDGKGSSGVAVAVAAGG